MDDTATRHGSARSLGFRNCGIEERFRVPDVGTRRARKGFGEGSDGEGSGEGKDSGEDSSEDPPQSGTNSGEDLGLLSFNSRVPRA